MRDLLKTYMDLLKNPKKINSGNCWFYQSFFYYGVDQRDQDFQSRSRHGHEDFYKTGHGHGHGHEDFHKTGHGHGHA